MRARPSPSALASWFWCVLLRSIGPFLCPWEGKKKFSLFNLNWNLDMVDNAKLPASQFFPLVVVDRVELTLLPSSWLPPQDVFSLSVYLMRPFVSSSICVIMKKNLHVCFSVHYHIFFVPSSIYNIIFSQRKYKRTCKSIRDTCLLRPPCTSILLAWLSSQLNSSSTDFSISGHSWQICQSILTSPPHLVQLWCYSLLESCSEMFPPHFISGEYLSLPTSQVHLQAI